MITKARIERLENNVTKKLDSIMYGIERIEKRLDKFEPKKKEWTL